MTRVLVMVGALLALELLGCSVKSGLNTQCNLPKRVDGGVSFLTEGEVQELTSSGSESTRDFIAFGAVDCEDLVCVRDATFPRGTDLAARAVGYCSRPCLEGAQCPSDDTGLDQRQDTKLNCRPLLLDKSTLAALAQSGLAPDVGNVKEPFFCARGSTPDAGK